MALPALALPALFMGGSVLANTIASRQQQGALDAAYGAERQRQRRFDDEARVVNERGRERYEDFGQQQEDRRGSLVDLYTQAQESAPARPVGAAPATGSNLVVNATNTAQGRTDADLADQAARRANFRSFGDILGDISTAQARDAGDLSMIGGFKRGSQSVLPSELQAAAARGGGMRLLGDLASLGAGVTLPHALIEPGSLAALYAGRAA